MNKTMKMKGKSTPKEIKRGNALSAQERRARKDQVLTQGRPSITRSIADAIVIKSGSIFFLALPDGDIPLWDSHGFGLYYHDCRFLNGYQLRLADASLSSLVSTQTSGAAAIFELTNPELKIGEGKHILADEIGITWQRMLDGDKNTLTDQILIMNFGREPVALPLLLTFQAGFEDIFAIRGLLSDRPGELLQPEWSEGKLVFSYKGADHIDRSLHIDFSPAPSKKDGTRVQFDLNLGPKESQVIHVLLTVSEVTDQDQLLSKSDGQVKSKSSPVNNGDLPQYISDQTQFTSSEILLDQIVQSSLRDLNMLLTSIDQHDFFAAGLPWFGTLFGRDSLITALQTLALHPGIAAQTLRLLAEFQATEIDEWRDAQPGKILHELRIGELAHLNEIPHSPYYGSVDATPLFLVLVARHAQWTGDLSLFHELRQPIERALRWIDQYGDANGDGYVEYESTSSKGLVNQGWKDSGNAIVDAEGNSATPPISLVEVQGYVYAAKTGLADLFERSGEAEQAAKLRQEAKELRENFNRDLWLEDLGIYALALEAGGKPLRVVSSNPGQALWTGIADPDKARRTAERLMANDMFSGWGIRTLSQGERAYNPIGYHLGTVWPHDNALIAAGFRRYGFDEFAQRIFEGIIEATMSFKGYRLPELFSGFSRDQYSVPVHYPVACHPQAWAAGSIPYLLSSFLGLEPAAFDGVLRIRQPILPSFVDVLDVQRLRVGQAKVDLHFERSSDREVRVNVLQIDGKLEVVKE